MADSWFIHRNEQLEGPKTAKEIRDLLRTGELDPFDKISATRDSEPLDIIAVDEVFQEQSSADSGQAIAEPGNLGDLALDGRLKLETALIPEDPSLKDYLREEEDRFGPADYQAQVNLAGSQAPAQFSFKPQDTENQLGQSQRDDAALPQEDLNAGVERIRAEEPKRTSVFQTKNSNHHFRQTDSTKKRATAGTTQGRARSDRRKRKKRYHVISPQNKEFGPMTSADVKKTHAELGRATKGVLVRRHGDNRKIPIDNFVKANSNRGNVKKTSMPSHNAYANPKPSSPPFSPGTIRTLRLAAGVVLLVLILAVLVGLLLRPSEENGTFSSNSPLAAKIPPATIDSLNEQFPPPLEVVRDNQRKAGNQNSSKANSVRSLESKPTSNSDKNQAARLEVKNRQPASPKKIQAKVAQVRPLKKEPKRSNPKPAVKRSQARKEVRTVSSSRPLANSVPRLPADGQEVVLPGATFNMRELSSCKGIKCNLAVKDSMGRQVQVSFFRLKFQARLLKSKGRATLIGVVGQQGKAVYLQKIR